MKSNLYKLKDILDQDIATKNLIPTNISNKNNKFLIIIIIKNIQFLLKKNNQVILMINKLNQI